MKVYKTQQEVENDIKNGVLAIEGDVKFECDISIEANIIVNAGDINAGDINAGDINAWDINAWDINAWDIKAGNINAGNINARDIKAGDINAWKILYHALCFSYKNIKCLSIEAKREKYQEPVCLDGKLEIKKIEREKIEEMTVEQICKELGREIKIIK